MRSWLSVKKPLFRYRTGINFILIADRIVLMPIRIRISMLLPIQIRTRNGIKAMPILIRILAQSLHCQLTMSYLSYHVKCVKSYNILASILKFSWKKVYFINFLICLELILVRIRQNDVDPIWSGSGSTTLLITIELFVRNLCTWVWWRVRRWLTPMSTMMRSLRNRRYFFSYLLG